MNQSNETSKSSKEPKEQEWNPYCKCLVHCQYIKQNQKGNVHVFKIKCISQVIV